MTTIRTPLVAFALALIGSTASAQDLPRPAKAPPAEAKPKPAPPKAPKAQPAPKVEAEAEGSSEAASETAPEAAAPAEASAPEAPPPEAPASAPETTAEAAAPEGPAEDTEPGAAGEAPATEAAPTAADAAPAVEGGAAAAPIEPSTPVFSYYPSAPRDERPEILPYHEGDAVPEGYYVDTRIRRGLVIAGGISFGVTYLAAAGVAVQVQNDEFDRVDEVFEDEDDASVLYIPVVGPFIAAGRLGDRHGGAAAVAAFDGLAQAAGLSMFIAGLAAKEMVLVKEEQTTVGLAPGAVGTASGMTLVGSF